VRIVDEREELAAGLDPLHPAGHTRAGLDPGGSCGGVDAGGYKGDDREGRVVDVEGTGQLGACRDASAVGADERERAAHGCAHKVFDAPVGTAVARWRHGHEDQPRVGSEARETGAVRIVHVDHGDARPRRREQRRLGLEVGLEVGVEVEVVLGQVGEHGDVERRAVDATQRQGMAGDLHGDCLDAAFAHHCEQRLQVGRLGGRADARHGFVTDAGLDGADQPGRPTGRPQSGLEKVGGGGLAVGARHADGGQRPRRLAVDPGGERAEHPARVVDDVRREARRACLVAPGGVGDAGDRPAVAGDGREARPVGASTRQRCVDVAGSHRPGVVCHTGDYHPRRLVGSVSRRLFGSRGTELRRELGEGVLDGSPGPQRRRSGGVWHGNEVTVRAR
jgi:hypothetical protein